MSTSARTGTPRAASAARTAEPMKPVAPVSATVVHAPAPCDAAAMADSSLPTGRSV